MVFSMHFRSYYGVFDAFSVVLSMWFWPDYGGFGVFPSPIMIFLEFSEPDLKFPSPFLEFPSLMERFIESEPRICWEVMSEND